MSDLLSEMYRRYELDGTTAQRRVLLVDFARRYRLVDAGDYQLAPSSRQPRRATSANA